MPKLTLALSQKLVNFDSPSPVVNIIPCKTQNYSISNIYQIFELHTKIVFEFFHEFYSLIDRSLAPVDVHDFKNGSTFARMHWLSVGLLCSKVHEKRIPIAKPICNAENGRAFNYKNSLIFHIDPLVCFLFIANAPNLHIKMLKIGWRLAKSLSSFAACENHVIV